MARKYIDTNVGDEPVRLGVDIPANTKLKYAIEARKASMTMTRATDALVNIGIAVLKAGKTFEQFDALVRAWLAGKITLPEK